MVDAGEFDKLKTLVTGGSGLLGVELVRLLTQAGASVVSTYSVHQPLAGAGVRLDLSELDAIEPLIRKIRPNTVIHAAAITDVDLCEKAPGKASRVNGEATGKIAEAARTVGAYVLYVSTDYVFDGEAGSYREENKPNPINQYGSSKLMGEELLDRSGVSHSIVRTSVVYGWGRPNFASWVLRGLESGKPLSVLEPQLASPTLNSNLAEMVIELAEKQFEGIMHLAGATRISRYDFARHLARAFRYDENLIQPSTTKPPSWRARRPSDSSLNVERANSVLSHKPLTMPAAVEQFSASRNEPRSVLT